MKNNTLIQFSTATPARAAGFLSRLSGAFGLGKTVLNLSLILAALALPGVALAGNLEGRYATITLDGSLSDWQSGDVMYSASEISVGAPLESTFTNVMVANDSNYVYIALQLPAPAAITNTWTYSALPRHGYDLDDRV